MNLTIDELKEIMEDFEWDHSAAGIRFEEKEYKVGDVISDSKHNHDREDERAFPEYGTEEYNEMAEFPGVSTYNSSIIEHVEEWIGYHKHCYIVVGDGKSWSDSIDDYVLDDDELVIEDGTVAYIIK